MERQEKREYFSEHEAFRLFIEAVKTGDLARVSSLIKEGIDVRAKEDYALQIASLHGHLEMVILLLNQGADVRAEEDLALRWAAENGHEKIVGLLLARGADLHAGDEEPLRMAVKNGHRILAELLLRKGADLHVFGDWPLLLAVKSGCLEMVSLLVENGADVHADNEEAFLAAVANGHVEITRLLIEKGADIYIKNEKALRTAAKKGYLEIVSLLTNKDKNYNCKENGNHLDTALTLAALNGHLEVVRFLLNKGANPFEVYDEELKEVAESGHEEIFRCLLESRLVYDIFNMNLPPEARSKIFLSLFRRGLETSHLTGHEFDEIMVESTLLSLTDGIITHFESSYPFFQGKWSERKAFFLRKKQTGISFSVAVFLKRVYYRPGGPGFLEAIRS